MNGKVMLLLDNNELAAVFGACGAIAMKMPANPTEEDQKQRKILMGVMEKCLEIKANPDAHKLS